MVKYHVNPETGKTGVCSASKRKCRYGGDSGSENHYNNETDAMRASEQIIAKSLEKENISTIPKTEKKIKYSFLEDFEEKEKAFDAKFNGIGTRFNNATFDPNIINERGYWYEKQNKLATKWTNLLTETKDYSITPEEVILMGKELGLDIKEVPEDVKSIYNDFKNPSKVYYAEMYYDHDPRTRMVQNPETHQWERKEVTRTRKVLLFSSTPTTGKFNFYTFRRSGIPIVGRDVFLKLDVRALIGAARIKKLTDENLFEATNRDIKVRQDWKDVAEVYSRIAYKLGEAQEEKKNFDSQRRYIKTHTGKVATAWMDKKHPDKIRQKMMKETTLNKVFRKVEIDNDVSPEEFKDFEESIFEAQHLMPKFPKEKTPELRIRKLGKHRASGIFFPHSNTVAVDIRNSGSYVHEMAHHWDIIVKDNLSLSKEFNEITREYSSNLELPPGIPASKASYYTTPTEVFARSFENYLHYKKGLDNRLIDKTKFTRFDHTPFQNEKLRELAFNFFDKLEKEAE